MWWKRAFDLTAAVVGVALLGGLLGGIAVAVLILDGRPILFRQERLGLGKRPFLIYKFRTMTAGEVTPCGRILRRTGLDELAQIFNILRGEMSVVGPRPLTADDVARLGWNDDYHACRWDRKPGITGLAQLYGGRGARMSWWMDQVYRRRMSLGLDSWIILLSFAVNLFGKRRMRLLLMQRRFDRKGFRAYS